MYFGRTAHYLARKRIFEVERMARINRGKPLDDVFRERVFDPLGMEDTGFVVPPDKLSRLPVAYQKNQQTGNLEVWDPAGEASFFAKPHGFSGANGGLVSTVDDYAAFARMMLNKGKVGNRQVLAAELVAAMMTDHIPQDVKARSPFIPGFWDLRGWGYALSTIRKVEPGEPRGFGWDGGYGTVAYWDTATGTIVLLFSQRLVEGPTYSEIFHRFLICCMRRTLSTGSLRKPRSIGWPRRHIVHTFAHR